MSVRTIEGWLLMADFKKNGTRCRVHPPTGESILCRFDEVHKDEVLKNILQYVRVVGETTEIATSEKIEGIWIRGIECIEECQEDLDRLPPGTPISQSFWESPTLQELAYSQNVRPMTNVRSLFGTWPGTTDDGFEEAINELRRSGTRQTHRP